MYDYINGEQVKCFYSPIYHIEENSLLGCKSVWYSGGDLCGYGTGDEVPLKTLYYRYKDNLAIIYTTDCDFVHTIRNGRVADTVAIGDLENSHFDGIDQVIGYTGNELNVKSADDVKQLIKDFKAYEEEVAEYRRDCIRLLDKRRDCKDNFMAKQEAEVEYEKAAKKHDEVRTKAFKKYINNWMVSDIYKEEKYFGELIECLAYLGDRHTEVSDTVSDEEANRNKEYLDCCIKEIKSLLDTDIFERYCMWSNYEYEEELRDVLNSI